jgi:hypothetical protein
MVPSSIEFQLRFAKTDQSIAASEAGAEGVTGTRAVSDGEESAGAGDSSVGKSSISVSRGRKGQKLRRWMAQGPSAMIASTC